MLGNKDVTKLDKTQLNNLLRSFLNQIEQCNIAQSQGHEYIYKEPIKDIKTRSLEAVSEIQSELKRRKRSINDKIDSFARLKCILEEAQHELSKLREE